MANSFTDLQTRQEVSNSMCRLTHKTQGGTRLRLQSYTRHHTKSWFKSEKFVAKHGRGKIEVATLWCKLESQCAETTTRGRRHKIAVRRLKGAS